MNSTQATHHPTQLTSATTLASCMVLCKLSTLPFTPTQPHQWPFICSQETPMRLYYQILESKIIQVPQTVTDKMFDASVPVKNNYVTNSNSQNSLNNAVQNSNDVQIETPRGDNFSNKLNLKRKPETNAVNSNTKAPPRENPPDLKPKEDVKVEDYELLEPSIKIPRISNTTLKDIMDSKKDGHEDKPKPTATVSPCTENGLKLPLKPVVSEDVVDDYVKYEQDIEEVEDDDDDDDDDRLRISQLSEEDTQDDKTGDTSDRQLVIDTSDFENVKEPKEEKLNGESKKSAKYKRKSKKSKHSHHHKHHRHHERKKQATPQATILHSPDTDIMKLKLKLSNVKSEVKHHRQKRKRKKSSECYFSSFSSSSSVSSASGMSPDAHGTSRVDEDSLHSHTSELSAESLDTTSFKDEPTPKITKVAEPANKYHSPTSKEKLLQMRAFRPKNVAVVKPEENHKLEKHVDKPKNDNNNNDKTIVPESKEKPKPIPTLLRPPSSITVSKITAAEKQKMEKEKLLMMNGNNDDKPSLEIMLVNGPPSSKPFTSPVSSTTDVTAKPKTPPRQIRPPPAAIPLLQYHKMKTTEQNIPKSLTITPQIQRPKSNEGVKKVKDTLSIRDSAKRSVTVSLSGNPFENDFTGALDLSGKSPRYPDMINVPQSLLNKKLCMNGVRPMPNGMSHYSPVKCMSNLADNVRPFHKTPSPNRYPMSSSPKHKISVSSPQTSPKPMSRPVAVKSKPNVPKLNEIKIGPVSSTTEIPPKPGPNQTVRHIPNPSIMLQRHQPILTSISSTNGTDYLPIKLCNPTPIMNHRVSANTCSFSTLKKNDKCPPAIPLKGYLDVSTIMATK